MERFCRITLIVLLALCCSPSSWGQKKNAPKDSVFRLVQAERAEQYEKYGQHYRLVKGHARFLHNDTYLLCDSASWNVDAKFIEAYGNVKVIQNNTMLKSEEMMYWIDDNKAQFRGPIVELFDKDGNTLRTSKLVYNTKDSVAVFEYGGALKDRDGNVIESGHGTYDGKEALFTFEDRVEIYMDTIEIKTNTLRYFSEEEKAYFGRNTYAWRDDGFLRADDGWYDRKQQIVRFADHVFMFDPTYDAWADEVFYDQLNGAADLYRNAQVLDTTNKSIYLGDHLQYMPAADTLSDRGLLTGDPAIIYFGENEDHVVDTLYARADTFFLYAVPRCDIPESELKEAQKRLEDIRFDALGKKRKEDAAAQEQERIKKMREVGKLPPEWVEKAQKATADSLAALARLDSLVSVGAVDSLVAASDSLRASTQSVDSLIKVGFNFLNPGTNRSLADSTVVPMGLSKDLADTTMSAKAPLPPRDTTPVRYVLAWNNVKMYRSDLQAVCDSVVFTEVDSIARLYGAPALWNEVRNQLTADEMHLLMHEGALERGSMITNAWMISEQDTLHYNQIRSTEMQGWFRDNKIYRFDALGGVSAIFYMADEDVITTINVKESKSLTAALKDGTAQRLLYVDAIKSDVYPVGELAPEKQRLKDFKWRGDERPVSAAAITQRKVRESERAQYEGMQRPLYRETNKYYDNYMLDLFEKIDAQKKAEFERRQAEQDSLARVAELEQLQAARDSLEAIAAAAAALDTIVPVAPGDTTQAVRDTVVAPPQRAVLPENDPVRPSRPPRENAGIIPGVTEDLVPASPETVIQSEQLSRAEKRALRRAERQARREARKAARAARRAAREAARIARQAAKVEKN
ncbi:MAG: hypothetical protein IKX34_00850 [Bacteroidales bacterium]|nr:hypothetical protein [Bacteroidales bacterium]